MMPPTSGPSLTLMPESEDDDDDEPRVEVDPEDDDEVDDDRVTTFSGSEPR